mgnify:CR=1 FL=1
MEINILIVDDSKTTLHFLKLLLESVDTHYNITMTNHGVKALRIVEKKEIDLIILDINMPDMDGFEVASSLKSNQKTADIPVVFLTASETLRTEGLALGAVDYLTKPIDRDLFISRISLYSRLLRSIKESKLKDQQLLKQTRLAQMGEMISMIAHQWRQPLASISAIAGTLSLDVMMDEYKKEFFQERLDSISELSEHLSSTIDDFRNFYQPNKKVVTTTLKAVTTNAIKIVESSLHSDNIEIIYDYTDKEVISLYDNEIMQVILNILKNTQDNFKEKNIKKPQIKITTKDKLISICDNGGGIPVNIIDKVFDPYFSTKDNKNGTGLGLYMSKMIIEEHHNGKLRANNQNNGVCFTIKFGAISTK